MGGAGDLVAVILAAGAGRRVGGRPKALLELGGRTLLARVVAGCRAAGLGRIVAVLAPGGVPDAAVPAGVVVVRNPLPERGMLSSIQAGLASEAARGAAGALVWPVDCPRVPPRVVAALAAALAHGAPLAIPRYGGRGGHPALFGAALFPEILALPPETRGGVRAVGQAHAREAAFVEVDAPEVLDDVDTLEALADLDRAEGDGGRRGA